MQNKVQNKVQNKISSESDYILLLIKENPSITQEEIAKKAEKSMRSTKYLMKKLLLEGKIERKGSRKTGVWLVKEEIEKK